ncbi:MAG: tripartite tricarboxylate transporter substrate binding protein, partial [Comamonadaceae bacterium]
RLKGYDMNVWFGLFGPAKMPAALTARLNKELNELLRDQDIWQKLQKAGISNDGGTAKALADAIRIESARVRGVVTKAVATGAAS